MATGSVGNTGDIPVIPWRRQETPEWQHGWMTSCHRQHQLHSLTYMIDYYSLFTQTHTMTSHQLIPVLHQQQLVKVISQKGRTCTFNRIRHVATTCTRSNTCFFGPTRVHSPNDISTASAVFAQLTTESLYCPSPSPSKLHLHMGHLVSIYVTITSSTTWHLTSTIALVCVCTECNNTGCLSGSLHCSANNTLLHSLARCQVNRYWSLPCLQVKIKPISV